jgi:aspartate/methionine/tyrosine aminotransferase
MCVWPTAGDGILLPEVLYPSYTGALHVAGLLPTYIPCRRDTWLPDLSAIDPADAHRASVLLLNYPNNPTGAC